MEKYARTLSSMASHSTWSVRCWVQTMFSRFITKVSYLCMCGLAHVSCISLDICKNIFFCLYISVTFVCNELICTGRWLLYSCKVHSLWTREVASRILQFQHLFLVFELYQEKSNDVAQRMCTQTLWKAYIWSKLATKLLCNVESSYKQASGK